MQEGEGLGARMLDILLRGVSTRNQRVLPDGGHRSRSTVSHDGGCRAELERLLNRRFEEVELLILNIDGMVFGDHHVIAAVGVDAEGHKHVLGIQEGATENAAAVQDLLEGLVRQGCRRPRNGSLIDGSKALRAAIRAVFGAEQPVQQAAAPTSCATSWTGCRSQSGTRCGRRCGPPGGWIRRPAGPSWRSWPNGWTRLSAASLREGLECFTINRLGLPACCIALATTNLIEVRRRE